MKRKLMLLLIFLLSCIFAYAHAGWADRMIRNSVNMSAVHTTIGTVQLVLCIVFFFLWKKCPVNNLLRMASGAISRKKTFTHITFWLLVAFFLAPYVGYIDACYLIVGMAAVGMAVVATVLSLFKGFRKFSTGSQCLYVLLSLAIQQIVGYAIYAACYNTKLIKEHFGYTDEKHQFFNFYVYPDIEAISFCLDYGAVLLILFLVPMSISIVLELVERMKNNKNNK